MNSLAQPTSHPLLKAALLASLATFSSLFAAPTDPDSPVRLGSNENPFGFSAKAQAAVIKAVQSGNYYNRNDVDDLVAACAAQEGVDKSFILPTAGSGPVLEMTALAYAKPGLNVVTAAPGYPQLTGKFASLGGTIKYVPVKANGGYDFDGLLKAIDAKTAIAYICNPNNPTGVLADPAELQKFILSAPPSVLVVVDEAYLELSDTGLLPNTASPLLKQRKNLLISRTFSKAYALAGFRAGYATADPEVLKKLMPYYMGAPSYLAAIAAKEALADKAHMQANQKNYSAVRQYVLKEFDRLGIKYYNPQGASILFKAGMPNKEVQKKLAADKIMVSTPFGLGPVADDYQDWVRVSVGTKEDMDQFLGSLMKALGKT